MSEKKQNFGCYMTSFGMDGSESDRWLRGRELQDSIAVGLALYAARPNPQTRDELITRARVRPENIDEVLGRLLKLRQIREHEGSFDLTDEGIKALRYREQVLDKFLQNIHRIEDRKDFEAVSEKAKEVSKLLRAGMTKESSKDADVLVLGVFMMVHGLMIAYDDALMILDK